MPETGSETARLDIAGMHCASCVGRVEEELVRTPGVLEASINLTAERATIRYAPGSADLPEGEVEPIELTPEAPGEYGFECGTGMLHGKLVVR